MSRLLSDKRGDDVRLQSEAERYIDITGDGVNDAAQAKVIQLRKRLLEKVRLCADKMASAILDKKCPIDFNPCILSVGGKIGRYFSLVNN